MFIMVDLHWKKCLPSKHDNLIEKNNTSALRKRITSYKWCGLWIRHIRIASLDLYHEKNATCNLTKFFTIITIYREYSFNLSTGDLSMSKTSDLLTEYKRMSSFGLTL